mmetsp:Transcript_15344/g.40498  ORF Transcript_15344/g.40498 Transcript_15344/m.40498 type:complete len:173 (+) Transcript_15344:101-619(+)
MQGGGRRTALRRVELTAVMQPCSSARGARRRHRASHGCARHRCTVLAAVLLSGCASALDAAPRRHVVTRLAAAAVAASSAPALADPRWPPDDAFSRISPPRGFTASVSDAAVDAARKQREKQREAALKELAEQERFQDDRMRRCREEVNDAWQDCFFLGTTPSRQRRGPATW